MAGTIRTAFPDQKILYVTGQLDRLMDARLTLWEGEAFLEKPFSVAALREAVSLLLYGSLTKPSAGEPPQCPTGARRPNRSNRTARLATGPEAQDRRRRGASPNPNPTPPADRRSGTAQFDPGGKDFRSLFPATSRLSPRAGRLAGDGPSKEDLRACLPTAGAFPSALSRSTSASGRSMPGARSTGRSRRCFLKRRGGSARPTRRSRPRWRCSD